MTRLTRPVKSHARADNRARQVFIVVTVIASVFGLGALATNQYLALAKRQTAGMFESANGSAIYTGSILYVPDTGNVCHQWQFDNQSGQFNDKGDISCDAVADQELDGPKNWSSARIRVIRDGFRDH